jgi:ribosomal protein L11 methylase PrmA
MLPVTKAVDIGANDGMFSELLAIQNIYTVAVDNDPEAVNNLYKKIKNSRSKLIHPLLINLDNPTPGFGFGHEERMSFVYRTKVDLVLALAIIHHLAIAKNVPFDLICKFLSRLGKILIIEFVPKEDPKINMMLQGRRDIFTNYDENHFLDAFSSKYKIIKSAEIGSSKRKLFLMEIK